LQEPCGNNLIKTKWTLEKCKSSAAKYQTRSAWKIADPNAYQTARYFDWLDICCEHMTDVYETWTLEKCKASAAKYQTRSAWANSDKNANQAAYRNGWLGICCEHMTDVYETWTLEKCKVCSATIRMTG